MKEYRTSKIQDIISNIFPAEPITFSFSYFRVFIIGLLFVLGISVLYIRMTNRNEIKLLESKHKEIQMMVDRYLTDMSQVNINENKQLELEREINGCKVRLKTIDENIKELKKSWLP